MKSFLTLKIERIAQFAIKTTNWRFLYCNIMLCCILCFVTDAGRSQTSDVLYRLKVTQCRGRGGVKRSRRHIAIRKRCSTTSTKSACCCFFTINFNFRFYFLFKRLAALFEPVQPDLRRWTCCRYQSSLRRVYAETPAILSAAVDSAFRTLPESNQKSIF